MNTNQVEDFSDLGKDFVFTYNNERYLVPPVTPKTAKNLIRMGRDITSKSKKSEEKIKQFEERGEEVPEEILSEMENVFDFQVDFIIAAGIQRFDVDTNVRTIVVKNEIYDVWSTKAVSRIFTRINEILSGDDSQEKKA